MKTRIAILLGMILLCNVRTCIARQDIPLEGGVEEEELNFPAAGGGAMEGEYRRQQAAAVDAELRVLKSELSLDDEWIESLKKSLTDDLDEAAKRISDAADESEVFGFDESLDGQLRELVWKKIEAELPDEKSAEFDAFKDMVNRMQKLKDETALNGVLVYLDNQLCLSKKQIDHLRNLYANDWDSMFNEEASMMSMNGMIMGRGTIDLVSNEEFKKTLSSEQYDLFKNLDESSSFMLMVQMAAMGQQDDSVDIEAIKVKCETALDLKIAEYDALVGISENGMKFLSVARKGAIAQVAGRFEKVLRLIDDDPNALNGMNVEVMGTLMDPVLSQCTGTSVWQKTLPKVFDEAKMQKISEREEVRTAVAKGQVLNYIVFSFSNMGADLALTVEQHERIVAVIRDRMDDAPVNLMALVAAVFTVPDEDFQEILSEEQWGSLKPVLDQQRAEMQAMEEAEGDTDEDEDDQQR